MVICLERGADLHMAQLMPLPLTVSCSSKIQIGFTFLVSAHLGPGKRAVKGVCVLTDIKDHILIIVQFTSRFTLVDAFVNVFIKALRLYRRLSESDFR